MAVVLTRLTPALGRHDHLRGCRFDKCWSMWELHELDCVYMEGQLLLNFLFMTVDCFKSSKCT